MLIIRLIGRDWLRPGITRMRLIMIQLALSFSNGNDWMILMLIIFMFIMIPLAVFTIPSLNHHQRKWINDSDINKIDHNYHQYHNIRSTKYISVLAVYRFCCNCFRANNGNKEQRNTDPQALMSYWIKLTERFCTFTWSPKKWIVLGTHLRNSKPDWTEKFWES